MTAGSSCSPPPPTRWKSTGTPLWSEKFDGALEDSFDWQDSVGETIAEEALGMILGAERAALARIPEVDLITEQMLLRGMMSLAALADHRRLVPSETLTSLRSLAAYAGSEAGDRFIRSLQLAGLPE